MKYIRTEKPAHGKVSHVMLALGVIIFLIGVFLSGLIPDVRAFEELMDTPGLLFCIGYLFMLIGIVWIMMACSFPPFNKAKADQIAYGENGELIEVYYD